MGGRAVGGAAEEPEETGNIIINLRLDGKHEPQRSVPSAGLQMAPVPDAVWALGDTETQAIICQECKERAANAFPLHLPPPLFSAYVGKSSLSTVLERLKKEFHRRLSLAHY